MKVKRCGAVDSKYFGRLDDFEKDVIRKNKEIKDFKDSIREMVVKDPAKIKEKYTLLVQILSEIKKEFNISL